MHTSPVVLQNGDLGSHFTTHQADVQIIWHNNFITNPRGISYINMTEVPVAPFRVKNAVVVPLRMFSNKRLRCLFKVLSRNNMTRDVFF